ncbi:MAG: serine/threonine protein kinase [Candidatus Krumholzibacteria bacterium]|nr:serine/threonine protein kinase [Candidatus Krumholzibacteria bacterium]
MTEKSSKKYEICNTLATGGTAVLYKAIQTSLDRPVVIKKLHSHLISDPNFTRRFQLEAKSAASLDHENIVRIIDFGSSEGNYYIVMEYIDGPSLKDVLSSRRIISEELALLIAREICMGLDHAHQHGIIHRDIKPANIMITREGQVKITDFGLAKLHQSQTQQTVASTLLGTPLYMSPEQAIGESIDGRSDLFSLGTICYEAITGTQPFLGDNYAVVIHNIINGSIPLPSQIRRDISPEAETLVMKALHRDPSKRFRNALEMACAIESLLGQEKILSARERLRRLAIGEDDATAAPRRPSRMRPRRKSRLPLSLAAAGVAAAIAVVALNPHGISNIANALKAIRESHPAPPPSEMAIAGQGEPISGVSMTILDESTPAARAVPDTAAAPLEAAPDTGIILENSTGRLALPDAEAARKEALEKARSVKDLDLASAKPVAPPAPAAAPVEGPRDEAPTIGYLDVTVDPPSDISIDGQFRTFGERLSMIELQTGTHELACRAEGRRDYVEAVQIKRGELSRRRISLEQLTGTLIIETRGGTHVYIDGVFKGNIPLPAPLTLPVGTHRVDLKSAGFQDWSDVIIVPRDETVRLSIDLVSLSASK